MAEVADELIGQDGLHHNILDRRIYVLYIAFLRKEKREKASGIKRLIKFNDLFIVCITCWAVSGLQPS